MNYKRWIAVGLLASVAAGAAYGVSREKPARAAALRAPVPEVKVAEVSLRDVAQSVELTGAVQAVESVALRARVSGFVESAALPEGGLVREGQLLFQLDPRPFRVAVERAKAELARAEAQRELAELRLARGSKLVNDAAISASTHDGLVADAAQARAAEVAARAAVRAAELELSYTRVLSPIEGRVGQSLVDAGNLVSGGTDGGTLLAEIVSTGAVHVEFDVDEPTYRRLLTSPRDAQGRILGPEVAIGLAGDEGFPHAATLDFLASTLDTSSGTARARATAANASQTLVPGLFARVRLAVDEPRPTVLISDRSISTDQEGRYVLVVNNQDVVEQRHIRIGAVSSGLRVVTSGLAAGDRVVVGGMVRPGMQVRTRLTAMSGTNDSLTIRSVP